MPAYNTYKSTMKKNTFLILSLLLLYLYPLSASVEIRSNKLTTGDGLANNSTRYTGQTHYIFTIFSFVISLLYCWLLTYYHLLMSIIFLIFIRYIKT